MLRTDTEAKPDIEATILWRAAAGVAHPRLGMSVFLDVRPRECQLLAMNRWSAEGRLANTKQHLRRDQS